MKRFLLILLTILAVTACGGKKSLKVTDPEERHAMRTRDLDCPIDSVFTAKAIKTTFDLTGSIKPKAFISDFKETLAASEEEKALEKAKSAYNSVKTDHAADYNTGLTIYTVAIVLVFAVMMLVKIFRAIFKND